jgi:hypothetical protein
VGTDYSAELPDDGRGPGELRGGVDARGAMGVQVGADNTQINYFYGELTRGSAVKLPPLVSVTGIIESPYRGLGAFEERDGPFFFGRDDAADAVVDRMSRCAGGPGLLVVSGASGAGKSSLLRAGVLPRLRGAGLAAAPGSQSWPCLLFTPGPAPLDELAVQVARLTGADAGAVRAAVAADPAGFALTARQAVATQSAAARQPSVVVQQAALAGTPASQATAPSRLLVIVDQFEQVFTQCPDEGQRRAFIAALHAAATKPSGPGQVPAAVVVLGVRVDFDIRCAAYAELASAVQDRYLLMPMTERQLRLAITEPAKKAGARVDDDLAELLLREVRSRQPGASAGVLPLLSHALDQAWRTKYPTSAVREGDAVGIADYERTGGIERAVGDSAQRAYDGLTPGQQAAARQVFTRLTATSDDGVDTASRAARAELTAGKDPAGARDVAAMLEAFAVARLLTLADGTVEISHEVLLTAWPLLRDTWLAETHADRIIRTQLRADATDWARHDHDAAYLYGGSLLETATATAARVKADPIRHPSLSHNEHDFLQASTRAREWRGRRRQGILALLTALVVGLGTLAAVAYSAQQDAARQRDIAISDELAARSEAIGDTDPRIARLLSVAAWRLYPVQRTSTLRNDDRSNPACAQHSHRPHQLRPFGGIQPRRHHPRHRQRRRHSPAVGCRLYR